MFWRGVITKGRVSDEPINGVDFMPTFAEISGVDIEKDKLPNGISSELFQYKDVVSVVATERTSSTIIFDDLNSQAGLSAGQVVNVAP